MSHTFLAYGQPAPWFTAATDKNPHYHFESIAGRYVVLCFLQSSQAPATQTLLTDLAQHRQMFDDLSCCFFGVSTDPEDQQFSRLQEQLPGIRFFWDFDQQVSQLFSVVDQQGLYHPCTYILDERLRVLHALPFGEQPDDHAQQLMKLLSELPELPLPSMAAIQAPILVVPHIFELELCHRLMEYYNQLGGEESGFMREKEGRTLYISDPGFKRRRDQEILDEDLRKTAMFRIHNCLVPEIAKAFQFKVTRIERHIVACYDSASGGFFRAHRDNTTKGTAHRRFAVSLNLNTGDYEGGMLRFPEFGRQTYTAPAGGAVVFSCSLLHEAMPVTQGLRYAYLPFLYDDAAAKIREMNRRFIGEEPEAVEEPQPSSVPEKLVPEKSRSKGFQPQSPGKKRR